MATADERHLVPGSWHAAMADCSCQWQSITTRPPEWATSLKAMERTYARIPAAERFSGPRDLLSIVDLAYREQVHTSVIAWLCDPEGSHGFGAEFLTRFLRSCGLQEAAAAAEGPVKQRIAVFTEKRISGEGEAGQFDILVRVGRSIVLIENKVLAGEHGGQLARYRRLAAIPDAWREQGPPTDFVALVLTASSSFAASCVKAGYRLARYRSSIAEPLRRTLGDGHGSEHGKRVALEYLQTLEKIS